MNIMPIDYRNVNEEAKKIIQYLLDYSFPFVDDKLYDVMYPKNPILIIGPDKMGEKYFRVYIFGAHAATIIISDDVCICKLCDSTEKWGKIAKKKEINGFSPNDDIYSYGKFLIDGFTDGKGNTYWLNSKIKSAYKVSGKDVKLTVYTEYCNYLKSKSANELLTNSHFLDLLSYVCYIRWVSIKDGVVSEPGEKCKQNCVAKNSMINAKYSEDKEKLVIDIEYMLNFSQEEQNKRADFVVFDGKSLGFIEFKYLGKSTENMASHYQDFYRLLVSSDETFRIGIIEELMHRLRLLIEYGVVDKSWEKAFNEFIKNDYNSSMMWCGFFFLGDKYDSEEMKSKLDMKSIKKKAKECHKLIMKSAKEEPIVKYQCSNIGYDSIIMSGRYDDL